MKAVNSVGAILQTGGTGGGGTFSGGFSTLGNTIGDTGIVTNRMVLAGGANVTLSGSTNAGSITITIVGGGGAGGVIATTVYDVGSTGSTGTVTRYAPEDHVHRGVNQVQITGNTSNTSNPVYGSVYLAGGNNITLSQVSAAGAATVTISGAAQTNQPVAASASNGSFNFSTLKFVEGSGVTWATQVGGIQASVKTDYLTGVNFSAGTTSSNLTQLKFVDSNGVSFGLGALSALTATVRTDYQSAGAYLTTAMLSNAATISNVNLSAGTTSQNLSAMVFSNSNGVSFGLNGSTVTGSIATSLTNVNLSAGTTSQNLSAMVFSNSNGVSFGLNGSTITGSVAAGAQTGISGIANSQTTFTSGTVSLSDQANITIASSVNGATQIFKFSVGNYITTAMLSNAATISNVNLSAGTTSQNLSAMVFSDSNGVSFGLNGSTVTGSVATSLTNVNVSAGTTSNNLSAMVFSNSNGVSFGLNGSTITGSVAAAGGAQTAISGIVVSDATYTSGTVSFSNQANITIGSSVDGVTQYIRLSGNAAQTNQTVGIYASSNTYLTSSGTIDARSMSFRGDKSITVGISAGEVLFSVGAYITTAMLSNAATISNVNLSAGTTSQNLSAMVFSNSNNVSFGLNGSTITGTVTVASTQASVNLSAGTTSSLGASFVFSNSNNVSFGLNGATVTATASGVAQTNQTLSHAMSSQTVGNTSGMSVDARSITWQGMGAVSVGVSTSAGGSSLLISAPNTIAQTVQTQGITVDQVSMGVSTGGNTQGNTTVQTGNRFVLVGTNGITLSQATGAGSTTISISGNAAQTNQTVGLYASSNTYLTSSGTVDARSLSFRGDKSITVGVSAGEVVFSVGAYITTAALSGDTSKYAQNWKLTSNTAGTTSSAFGTDLWLAGGQGITLSGNSNSITFSVGSYITTADLSANSSNYFRNWKLTGNTAGTTSSAQGTDFWLAGGNNITVSGNSNSITISAFNQSNQTLGLYMSSNTTSSVSSGTVDARSMTFRGVGLASVGYSGGEVVISVPAGAPSPVNFSAGTTSGNLGSVVFSNSNGVSFGLNGSTITASAAGGGGGIGGGVSTGGNTAGSTGTVTTGNIVFVGSGPISLSQSTGAAGASATISIIGPATSSLVGASGLSVSTNGSTITVYDGRNMGYYEPYGRLSNSANLAIAAKSWYIAPFVLPVNISGGRVNFYASMTSTAGIMRHYTANLASNTTGTKRQEYTYSLQAALWSQGTGTNSTRLESLWSNSFSFGISHLAVASVTGGANSVSANVSFSLSYISDIDSNGAYTLNQFFSGATSNGTNTSIGSGWADTGTARISIQNVLSDACIIPVGINTTLSAGNYWMGVQYDETTASSLTNAVGMASALIMSQVGFLGISRLTIDMSYKHWGSTTTANSQMALNPYGRYTASSAVPPQFIVISADLASTASAWVPYFNFQARGLTK